MEVKDVFIVHFSHILPQLIHYQIRIFEVENRVTKTSTNIDLIHLYKTMYDIFAGYVQPTFAPKTNLRQR